MSSLTIEIWILWHLSKAYGDLRNMKMYSILWINYPVKFYTNQKGVGHDAEEF